MTEGLKPYPAYKPSGVPWLGGVPEGWGMRSFGSLAVERKLRGGADLPLLSVLREKGVVLRSNLSEEKNRNYAPDDLSNYRVVRAGDLAINKMKAWQGSLDTSPCDGPVSPAYYVYTARRRQPAVCSQAPAQQALCCLLQPSVGRRPHRAMGLC